MVTGRRMDGYYGYKSHFHRRSSSGGGSDLPKCHMLTNVRHQKEGIMQWCTLACLFLTCAWLEVPEYTMTTRGKAELAICKSKVNYPFSSKRKHNLLYKEFRFNVSISFTFQITQQAWGQGLGYTALRRSSQYSEKQGSHVYLGKNEKELSSKIIREGMEVRICIRLCPGCGLPGDYTADWLIMRMATDTVMLNALMEFIFTSELHVNHENECCCCQAQTS